MHPYRSIMVLAIDAGNLDPFINVCLSTGPAAGETCTARKTFPFSSAPEVRDILGWASIAFLSAADQLGDDGWTIEHHAGCEDGKELGLDA